MKVIIGSNFNSFITYVEGLLNSEITAIPCLYPNIIENAKANRQAKIIVDIHSVGSMNECYGCNILNDLRKENLHNPVIILTWLSRKYILQITSNNTSNNRWLYNTYEYCYKIRQNPVNANELQLLINELKTFTNE